jgi:hypothetical protein
MPVTMVRNLDEVEKTAREQIGHNHESQAEIEPSEEIRNNFSATTLVRHRNRFVAHIAFAAAQFYKIASVPGSIVIETRSGNSARKSFTTQSTASSLCLPALSRR